MKSASAPVRVSKLIEDTLIMVLIRRESVSWASRGGILVRDAYTEHLRAGNTALESTPLRPRRDTERPNKTLAGQVHRRPKATNPMRP